MDLSWTQILAYVINIVILFLFLRWLLYKPVRKFLAEREQRFVQRREDLEAREGDAEALRKKYEQALADAHEESSRIMQESRIQANRRAEEILEEARRQSKDLIDRARAEIQEERRVSRQAMREEVALLAIDIASRVLEREVTLEDNRAIVEKFLSRERIG
jgi:F-type H+-transporting ATPase subunit b